MWQSVFRLECESELGTDAGFVGVSNRSFPLGQFACGSFRPSLVGRFTYIFIQAIWIEVRYVLVYKGVEGVWGFGVHLVIALSFFSFFHYVLTSEEDVRRGLVNECKRGLAENKRGAELRKRIYRCETRVSSGLLIQYLLLMSFIL